MPRSVLEAIKQGQWNFEPASDVGETEATHALPGSSEKLQVLAERLRLGLPLWNNGDRRTYDDQDND